MFFLRSGIKGIFPLLLIAVFLLAGIGAWASPDCCGHPSGSARADCSETDNSKTGTSQNDGDCISLCCQTYTAFCPVQHLASSPDPLWYVVGADEFGVSHTDTDIYRPPIA